MSYTTKLCDLCRARPATVRVDVVEDGRRRTLDLCEHDYARLRQESPRSPWESLFEEFSSSEGSRWGGDREAVGVQAYLSQQARDLLQAAAQVAVGFGKKELDTEHVLHALTESEVVREILRKLKLSAEDVRGHVEHNAPRGELRAAKGETVRVGITPRVKAVLERAFATSRELGHAYVGPEHLLVGLVEEPDGLGGDILRRYGVAPEGVRRKAVQVVGRGRDEDRAELR
ncbi:MAG: Clp protease N-terminal domain-containing protein, partial [Candidatus Bipolaricaulota bacterium]